MAFNTFLQCLVFGVLIMAVSQVDGAELDALAKCLADCETKHNQATDRIDSASRNRKSSETCWDCVGDGFFALADLVDCREACENGAAGGAAAAGAGGAAITSFTFLLSLAIGLFAM